MIGVAGAALLPRTRGRGCAAFCLTTTISFLFAVDSEQAAENRRLLEAKAARYAKEKADNMHFAQRFRREGEDYVSEERRKKAEKLAMYRRHQESLAEQIQIRKLNPPDPNKVNMSDHERKINGEVLKKLESDPVRLLTRVVCCVPCACGLCGEQLLLDVGANVLLSNTPTPAPCPCCVLCDVRVAPGAVGEGHEAPQRECKD